MQFIYFIVQYCTVEHPYWESIEQILSNQPIVTCGFSWLTNYIFILCVTAYVHVCVYLFVCNVIVCVCVFYFVIFVLLLICSNCIFKMSKINELELELERSHLQVNCFLMTKNAFIFFVP